MPQKQLLMILASEIEMLEQNEAGRSSVKSVTGSEMKIFAFYIFVCIVRVMYLEELQLRIPLKGNVVNNIDLGYGNELLRIEHEMTRRLGT